jgi:hypothetical protein
VSIGDGWRWSSHQSGQSAQQTGQVKSSQVKSSHLFAVGRRFLFVGAGASAGWQQSVGHSYRGVLLRLCMAVYDRQTAFNVLVQYR